MGNMDDDDMTSDEFDRLLSQGQPVDLSVDFFGAPPALDLD
jgi:hypothetical protein